MTMKHWVILQTLYICSYLNEIYVIGKKNN